MTTTKKKHELESRIRAGEFGAATQFLYSAESEFRLVNDFSGYDKIFSKFVDLKLELKTMLNKRRSANQQQSEAQLNLLTEKYKTPFEKRTFSLFTNNNAQNSSSESNRSKKRTVEDIDDDDEEEKPQKIKKTKKIPKEKIPKKKKKNQNHKRRRRNC